MSLRGWWHSLVGERVKASSGSQIHEAQTMGPHTELVSGYVPRQVNPWLYEALREAIGPIDGAIGRLVTMDGILRVKGGSDKLVAEIEDWMTHVPVGDLEGGLQALYAGMGNEAYEQGFAVADWATDRSGREITSLHVADSKGVIFRRVGGKMLAYYRPPAIRHGRRDGLDQLETILRNGGQSVALEAMSEIGFKPVRPDRMIYVGIAVEAGDPYGVSMIRACEFASQNLLRMQTATGNVWDRYGDPPLSMTYKTKARGLKPEDLDKRRDKLAKELAAAMDAKRRGNSVDFVQAIAADDDIAINVIGAGKVVMEIEMPARHMLEQIVAKFGIPSWMLGFHWSTAERLADAQSTIVLQEAKTRFERRRAPLERLVATMLRMRGRTWQREDWRLEQELPNLQDELRQAQASFLRAQEQMMLRGAGVAGEAVPSGASAQGMGAAGGAKVLADGSIEWQWGQAIRSKAPALPGEPWAEADPELPRIERRLASDMKRLWREFGEAVIAALDLPAGKSSGGPGWVWSGGSVLGILERIAEDYLMRIGGPTGVLVRAAFDMWLRGLRNAAAEVDQTPIVEGIADQFRNDLLTRALELVRGGFDRNWRDGVLRTLEEGLLDGLSPRDVARRLRELFAGVDYDWDRLAASEMAAAQVRGKLAEYQALGIAKFDFVTATDARVCTICTGHADAGPYLVSDGAPLPMIDSHPLCRCTIVAADDE